MLSRCQHQNLRSLVVSSGRRALSSVSNISELVSSYVVSTRSRHLVSSYRLADGVITTDANIDASKKFSVPLTVSDVHLRHEQLPFAYYFEETLEPELLQSSLSRVLEHFPVVCGKINPVHFRTIDCCPTDTIPLSFGDINMSLDEWLSETRGHSFVAGKGHPILLPLFDPLFENDDNSTHESSPYENLVKIRVSYFECGGTAIGVNFLHALGDTASCVRFVECWGKEMQKLAYPRGACNIRANANVSGMMTEELADLMGLAQELQKNRQPTIQKSWWFPKPSFLNWFYANKKGEDLNIEKVDDVGVEHQYLSLHFPSQVLVAMKKMAMLTYAEDIVASGDTTKPFVSTNDMVTAFGWLLKRALSGEHDWKISMVVNMRGRCGVSAFTNMSGLPLGIDGAQTMPTTEGLFGNGITNVVAIHPPTNGTFDFLDVLRAARSIRVALEEGISQLPDRLIQSRIGKLSQQASTANSFPTTSWSQFQMKDISFSGKSSLAAFHGDPSHPLPSGATYSSVIQRSPWRQANALSGTPSSVVDEAGVNFNLLLPSGKVEEARQKHFEICEAFLNAIPLQTTTEIQHT